MVKIDLLKEHKSIRNSLRPHPKQAKKPSLGKMRVIMSILFIGIFVAYWYYPEDWENKPAGMLEYIARFEGNVVVPEEEEKSSDLLDTVVEEPEPAQPAVKPEKNVPINEPPVEEKKEPAKTQTPEAKTQEIAAEPQKVVKTELKNPTSLGKWHIRFGFCLHPSSCVAQQKSLAKKNIQARIVDGFVMLTKHKAVIGPWPTETQAKETISVLSGIGVTVNMFQVGTNRYLATMPTLSKKSAEQIKEKIASHKYRVSISSKREKTAVGKVFLSRNFNDRKSAMIELNKFRKSGLDSIVEQEQ